MHQKLIYLIVLSIFQNMYWIVLLYLNVINIIIIIVNWESEIDLTILNEKGTFIFVTDVIHKSLDSNDFIAFIVRILTMNKI